jgi:hypothetical protein
MGNRRLQRFDHYDPLRALVRRHELRILSGLIRVLDGYGSG